ncbi:hypothetical protein DFH06DRAFT_1334909 [Mycena polygramma]|nr:hypothetical protein DFH06DRAFT_1334909 [Mycena polygramma]
MMRRTLLLVSLAPRVTTPYSPLMEYSSCGTTFFDGFEFRGIRGDTECNNLGEEEYTRIVRGRNLDTAYTNDVIMSPLPFLTFPSLLPHCLPLLRPSPVPCPLPSSSPPTIILLLIPIQTCIFIMLMRTCDSHLTSKVGTLVVVDTLLVTDTRLFRMAARWRAGGGVARHGRD